MKPDAVVDLAQELKEVHEEEREQLDVVRRYWRGRQALPAVIPSAAPHEVKVMARIARVNICKIVVDAMTQSMYVDGFRTDLESENNPVWAAWQRNRLDARQTGIHRAAFAYGASYCVVLPGDSEPVMRGSSPRNLTALYGNDPDWPDAAIERLGRSRDGSSLWRIYDETHSYFVKEGRPAAGSQEREWTFISSSEHGAGVTPVVRFLDEEDLDADDEVEPADRQSDLPILRGQVSPLFSIQDQIDLTTFNLLVAQHYNGFRQRYIVGWTADSEEERMKAAASQVWTFDEDADLMKLGEFEQTDLSGYIESREASLRHGATLSQTPVHELVGQLVNMAAEALAAAEAGKDRKVDERQALAGESWEQALWLAGRYKGIEIPDDSQVRWRDTSAQAFAATVDALGKLAQMLGIPREELWERVPGATPADVARWKEKSKQGDSFAQLTDLLDRQSDPVV